VLLEGLNDHVNLGAIARSARALGADALVLDPTCTDPWYRRSVRVSMGELLRLPVVRSTDWQTTLDDIAAAGITVWALTPDAAGSDIYELEPPERLAIVVGAEGPGLSSTTLASHTKVRIPMHGGVDSLNVGHAVAVALAVARTPRP
jgi:tRNA G18 (ribose-2'-O)-methylase SpoU